MPLQHDVSLGALIMATNYLRAYRADGPVTDGGGSGGDDAPMTFVASTAGVKRDGLEIDQSRWDLGPFRNNPVVLWAHDYASRPLGRADVDKTRTIFTHPKTTTSIVFEITDNEA